MTRVVVLGAGVAGSNVVGHLVRSRAARFGLEVAVIEAARVGVARPLLPFVAAGLLPAGAAAVDLRRLGGRARVVGLEITHVDTGAKCLTGRDPATGRESELTYDHLVVTLGGAVQDGGVPGVSAHAMCVRTPADAVALRSRVTEATGARSRLRVAVVGAGQAGIAIASLLSRSERHTAVTLVDRRPRLLPSFGRDLGTALTAALASSGVEWRPESAVTEVGAESLVLRDGTELPCSVVVWAAGHRSAPAVESAFSSAEITAGGSLVTDPMLRVRGAADVWACGDCASVPWLDVGGDCPPTGTFARLQASRVAVNIDRVLRGERPRSFRRDVPVLVPAGPRAAVGTIRGLHLSGLPGAAAWAASLGYTWRRLGRVCTDPYLDSEASTTALRMRPDTSSESSTRVALGGTRRRPA